MERWTDGNIVDWRCIGVLTNENRSFTRYDVFCNIVETISSSFPSSGFHSHSLFAARARSTSGDGVLPGLTGDLATQLVVGVVDLLQELVNLCSAKGSLMILPTILFLSTGVLKETAVKTIDPVEVGLGSEESSF